MTTSGSLAFARFPSNELLDAIVTTATTPAEKSTSG
jgi:hypothetical protein